MDYLRLSEPQDLAVVAIIAILFLGFLAIAGVLNAIGA